MAKFGIQRAKNREGSTIYCYTAPGHNECVATRLWDKEGGGPNDLEGAKMIMGITWFTPGGEVEYSSNPMESIYYILEGEMTMTIEGGEPVLLKEGDSFHCVGGVKKGAKNTGEVLTKMLVCLLPPA